MIGSQRQALAMIDLSRSTWHYRSNPRPPVTEALPQRDRAYPARICEADRAAIGVEARLREHPREDVQAAAHLLAVALAVLPAEHLRFDLLAHCSGSLPGARASQARNSASVGCDG